MNVTIPYEIIDKVALVLRQNITNIGIKKYLPISLDVILICSFPHLCVMLEFRDCL